MPPQHKERYTRAHDNAELSIVPTSVSEQRASTLLGEVEGLKLDLLDLLAVLVKKPDLVKVTYEEKVFMVYYQFVGKMVSALDVRGLLKRRLVERRVVDRVTVCPTCDSTLVRLRLRCPHCNSINLVNTKLVQHTLCGYTDLMIKFYDEGRETWICPNCGARIDPKSELVDIGSTYYCYDCRRNFSRPLIRVYCRVCKTETPIHEMKYEAVYSLIPTDKGRRVIFAATDMVYAAILAYRGEGVEFDLDRVVGVSEAGVEVRVDVSGGGYCFDFYDNVTYANAMNIVVKRNWVKGCKYKVYARNVDPVAEGILGIGGVDYAALDLPSNVYKDILKLLSGERER